jgi:hypothetical protein
VYSDVVQSILAQIRSLPTDQRVALADEVDRLAWRDRVQAVLDRIAVNVAREGPISDDEIDAIVNEVRSEKSLYERYWTRRQQ